MLRRTRVEAEQNFDAWGRRRNVATWIPMAPTAATSLPVWLYRGYTGHEQLDQFGLINMNGRLYDPALGRVLSADNFVVGSSSTQAYNRYTYAYNNPLLYSDPDGENPVIGALIGGLGYTLGVAFSDGGFRNWNWKQFAASVAVGAITSGIDFVATIRMQESSFFRSIMLQHPSFFAKIGIFGLKIHGEIYKIGFWSISAVATKSLEYLPS